MPGRSKVVFLGPFPNTSKNAVFPTCGHLDLQPMLIGGYMGGRFLKLMCTNDFVML